ncbi:TetR family transcriptional regulator [Antricoccus suffuscus]|uniref:TetR family transcriptional regulator n=1 Tax=Antricoccus suffuscus TaxID=1629062 RepID=A0A2T0ZXT2_9ACTN|nr:TetR family transcriptional regulator [Antricoccus suffuscus]PRZ41166.1 TetR family transcriptional regulator [Antricoccus suffuscus]
MARQPQTDRDTILVAALSIADERGLDALTMRAVAERVGVTPMALYRHVGGKSQLLDGLVERMLLEVVVPGTALPWREQLTKMTGSLRAVASRHPEVFPLLMQRPAATEGAKRVRDAVYATLRAAGVAADEVPRVERILSTFVIGFAASEAGGRFTVGRRALDEDLAWFGDHFLTAIDGGDDNRED